MRHNRIGRAAFLVGAALIAYALNLNVPGLRAQTCPEPDRVSRAEILEAMKGHGAYSLTSTTTSMRFGAEALLAIVRRRQRESPESTQLLIPQSDWFAAHQQTAGATYAAMSQQMKRPLEFRYGEPSCQARLRMDRRDGAGPGSVSPLP
jgi:hypothetical protein